MSSISGHDSYTLDSVVSDVNGTRKSVLNHFISLEANGVLVTDVWKSVAFPLWNDGGEADQYGFIPLLSDHVVSLRDMRMDYLVTVSAAGSEKVEYYNLQCVNMRIVEYVKDMGAWSVGNILVDTYGCASDEHDLKMQDKGINNVVFRAGRAYQVEVRLKLNNFSGADGHFFGVASVSGSFYESF